MNATEQWPRRATAVRRGKAARDRNRPARIPAILRRFLRPHMRHRRVTAFATAPWMAIVVATWVTGGALADPESPETVVGVVDQIQLIDASPLGGDQELLVVLENDTAFRFPGTEHLAAGSGAHVEIRYLPTAPADTVPTACSARVLALPLGDGEMQQARRPLEVYDNPAPACTEPE